jgi:hypothetical protein
VVTFGRAHVESGDEMPAVGTDAEVVHGHCAGPGPVAVH